MVAGNDGPIAAGLSHTHTRTHTQTHTHTHTHTHMHTYTHTNTRTHTTAITTTNHSSHLPAALRLPACRHVLGRERFRFLASHGLRSGRAVPACVRKAEAEAGPGVGAGAGVGAKASRKWQWQWQWQWQWKWQRQRETCDFTTRYVRRHTRSGERPSSPLQAKTTAAKT